MTKQVVNELLSMGIISANEQETALDIIERCAINVGIPTAITGAITVGATATFWLPGYGTLTGATAGALYGLANGTINCMSLNFLVRGELRDLIRKSQTLPAR